MQPFQKVMFLLLSMRTQNVAAFSRIPAMAAPRLLSSAGKESQVVNDMLYRIRQVNYMPDDVRSSLIPLVVDGVELGKVRPAMVEILLSTNSRVFELQNESLTLSASIAGTTCESRTEAVQSVMQELRNKGIINGWRDELYPMSNSFYEPPVFLMERAAVPFLGGVEYGVHLNGLVMDNDENIVKMWVARRAKTKATYGGMLDHMVAGGQPAGMSLIDNIVKECLEEAGVPEVLTRASIKAAGAISYETYQSDKEVISRAVLFCYDLWLPQDFQPTVVDGEVEDFFLWTMDEVKASMAVEFKDPIKPNCYPVIIDFLLRAGRISPDTPGYLDIIRELRGGVCR